MHHIPRNEVSAVWAQLSEIHELFQEHMMGES
jgi:hypothetical protein